ncbi:SDR family oxidoreductase [Actinoplanes sp. NPDC026623]|uniref:SDR family oxidoreductase n=1 Tax=Actinoplanes sp. NPDC026623 TaxID=3155610 RepID=UPI0033D96C3A
MTHQQDDKSVERLAPQYLRSAEELRPCGRRSGEPGRLLLTGASGFLGRSLLKRIVKAMPDQDIFCLVRDENSFRSGLSGMSVSGQVHPLIGDLSLPLLGLSAQQWTELGQEVSTIVHAGASVNHFLSLERMVDTNVSGTLALLRLAGEHRDKRMHFISSMSILGRDHAGNRANRLPPQPPPGGYAQSKWLAECLTKICQSAGFDVSTYRVGGLGPDTETGEVNPRDWRWLTMRAALESGRWPISHGGPRWLPVDVAARMVIGNLAHHTAPAERYHLVAPSRPTWDAVFDELVRLGHDLERVDRETWFDTMRDRARARDETAMGILALRLPRQADRENAAQNQDTGAVPIGGVHPESWAPEHLPVTILWAARHGLLEARATSARWSSSSHRAGFPIPDSGRVVQKSVDTHRCHGG